LNPSGDYNSRSRCRSCRCSTSANLALSLLISQRLAMLMPMISRMIMNSKSSRNILTPYSPIFTIWDDFSLLIICSLFTSYPYFSAQPFTILSLTPWFPDNNLQFVQIGGLRSMSQAPSGSWIQHSTAPSATNSSSSPPGNGSTGMTSPLFTVPMQVPQLPDVQFVAISTPATSATSTSVMPGAASAAPSSKAPR
jgi:hypothetical protein